jgi:hypothetical protein
MFIDEHETTVCIATTSQQAFDLAQSLLQWYQSYQIM